MGFTIPSNDLRFVLDRLAKYGDVRAGMLPIRTQEVTCLMAAAIDVPSAGGTLIGSLGPEADLMNHQIQPGDVITPLNNEPITDPRDLAHKAAFLPAGSKAALELYRAGRSMTVEVPVLPLESATKSTENNGFQAGPVFSGRRSQFPDLVVLAITDQDGAVRRH